jgi:hypothetical protein
MTPEQERINLLANNPAQLHIFDLVHYLIQK